MPFKGSLFLERQPIWDSFSGKRPRDFSVGILFELRFCCLWRFCCFPEILLFRDSSRKMGGLLPKRLEKRGKKQLLLQKAIVATIASASEKAFEMFPTIASASEKVFEMFPTIAIASEKVFEMFPSFFWLL